jgi:hypothetical protein
MASRAGRTLAAMRRWFTVGAIGSARAELARAPGVWLSPNHKCRSDPHRDRVSRPD